MDGPPSFPDEARSNELIQNLSLNEKGLTEIIHKPLKYMVGRAGIEPATLCLKGRYSTY